MNTLRTRLVLLLLLLTAAHGAKAQDDGGDIIILRQSGNLGITFIKSTAYEGKTSLRFNGVINLWEYGERSSLPGVGQLSNGLISFGETSSRGPTVANFSASSSEPSAAEGYYYRHQRTLKRISGSMTGLFNGDTSFYLSESTLDLNETYRSSKYGLGGLGFSVSLENNVESYNSAYVSILSRSTDESVSFSDSLIELDYNFSNLIPGAEVVWENSNYGYVMRITLSVEESKTKEEPIAVLKIEKKEVITGPTQDVINSANTTGMFLSDSTVSGVNGAIGTVIGGLHNGRIVRARSHMSNPRLFNSQSWVTANRALPQYLNFAANQGITMRQALGLEDMPAAASVADGGLPVMMNLSIGQGKAPIDAKAIAADLHEPERWELYTVGDIGNVEQDALDAVNRGFKNNTYAGSVGVEYFASENLNVGTAFSYAESDTDLEQNLGSVDLEGQMASVYATYFKNGAYADVLYSYGSFENDLVRNTLTAGGNAFGNTDSDTHTFSVNGGKNFEFQGLVTGPTLGFDHTQGEIDGYTETGGGLAALAYGTRKFESSVSSLGWQMSRTKRVNSGLFTLQGSAAWEHEYQPDSGVVNASLVAAPAFTFNRPGAAPGTDWLTLGAGLRLLSDNGVNFEIDYQTQLLREDLTAHYLGFKISTLF